MSEAVPMRHIVIVGATSAIAEHCARRWVAANAVRLTLVARDAVRAERVAADLRVRSPASSIDVIETSFEHADAIAALVERVCAAGVPDCVLVAHGTLPDQRATEQDLAACEDALVVNGLSPCLFAEAFAGRMQGAGRGRLAVIGSVAGDRGRRSNYIYGAAKGLVDRYLEGLQHRLAYTAVRVTLVKPGPTDTPMTATMKASGGRVAPVEDVAARIVHGIARGSSVVYAPAKWRVIMTVIRLLPRFVFDRLDI